MAQIPQTQRFCKRFWQEFQPTQSYAQAWKATRVWFYADAQQRGKDPRQSWNTTSGKAFELIGQDIIVQIVKASPLASRIKVQRWTEVDPKFKGGILAEQVWPRGQLQPAIAESNIDVSAFLLDAEGKIERVVAVYSCKTSAAERYQEDLYWADIFRGRGIRFCGVSIDEKFIKYTAGEAVSEEFSKGVTLGLAHYDRIYLVTDKPIVQGKPVFARIEEVPNDLDIWIKAY